jgi:Mg-chelatase subunit ChlD
MNKWSSHRRALVSLIILVALIALVGVPIYLFFHKDPTCFDGRKNGLEIGVDCGGDCRLFCVDETLPLISVGDPRIVVVSPGIYEVVAIFDNPNPTANVTRAQYTINLYESSSSTPSKVIEGSTFIPKAGSFVIFEGPFSFDKLPVRAVLEWNDSTLIWLRNDESAPELTISGKRLTGEDSQPRLEASLSNNSLDRVSNIELTAVISDDTGNIVAASKTFIDALNPSNSTPIIFTWPHRLNLSENLCSFPVDVALVIDRSGSMESLGSDPPQPLSDVKDTALFFIDQGGKNDRYAIISFAGEATKPIDAELNVGIETSKQAIKDISILRDGTIQNTNIGSAILSAREELNSPRHRTEADKVIVLLTDGVPTLPQKTGVSGYPFSYSISSAELARRDGISIYTIGLGKEVNMNLLKDLTDATLDAYYAPTTDELNAIYLQIATKICKKNPAVLNIYTRVFPDRSYLR